MTTTVNIRLKMRGRLAADWTSGNEVLLAREMGIETDTRKFKFGDGTTAWNSLAYAGPAYATGVVAFLETPSSANLRAALTDETGTGVAVFADAPTLNGQVTVKGTGTSTGVAFQTQDSAAVAGVTITDNGRMMGGTTTSTFPYYFVSSGSNTLVGERSSSATSLTSSVVSGGAFRNPDTTNGNYCSLQFLGVTTTAAGITAGHIACVMTDHTNGSFDSDLAFVTRNANNLLVAGRLTNVGDWTVTGSMQALSATAIPAGGTAGAGVKIFSTSNFGVFGGSGAPTLSAAKGSLYLRSDGSGTGDRAYINTDGGTTWTALTTAA